jgi:hypothetical protein
VPLRFGTLVVFTDGTDRAHRANPDDVTRALDGAGFETYVIGVGQEVDGSQLRRIGRSGTYASQNQADIQTGFDEIAARIEASSKKFYLLSYCSPSRAGEHEVQIQANGAGSSGRLGYRFNASGFGPTCDPNQKPAFDVRHPKATPPPNVRVSEAPPAPSRAPPPSRPPPADGRGASGSGAVGSGWQPKR